MSNEKTDERLEPVSIHLTPSTQKEMEELADEMDTSVSWVGRRAIKQFLESNS